MAEEQKDSFFTSHGRYFNSRHIKKNAPIPFRDHPQFPVMVDILGRKNNHHAILRTEFSATLHTYFLEAFLQYLSQEHISLNLRGTDLIYLDINHLSLSSMRKSIENDFLKMREELDAAEKYLIFVLPGPHWLAKEKDHSDESFLREQLQTLFFHPRCRFLVMSTSKEQKQRHFTENLFTSLDIANIGEADIMTTLNYLRTEFENFHHVLIPDELLSQAYALTERYLSTSNTLEKTLDLLDSSSARAGALQHTDHQGTLKPVVTLSILTEVLSGWTQIPAARLPLNKFKQQEFTQELQQKIFGQEAAVTILGEELQQAQAILRQKNSGPFCNLLFAGPKHAGKKTLAIAMAECLFRQTNMFYFAQPPSALASITDLKLQRYVDNQNAPLKDVIRQTPYAIIMIEDIDQSSPAAMEGLQEILSSGYLHDDEGIQYNFRQAILLLTTTLGTTRLTDIAKNLALEEEAHDIDLLQLVMSDQKHDTFTPHRHSPRELADEIMPEIANYLPAALCQHLHIVPFLPLAKTAIEQIMRLKLKLLGKYIESRYAIDLGYAPEVVRFLASEALKKKDLGSHQLNTEKVLKHLYFIVEQAILNQPENKTGQSHLLLQLNETGRELRCDWLMNVRHHAT